MDKDLNDMNLKEFLAGLTKGGHISFHMPGHKGRRFFDALGLSVEIDRLLEGDITEISGADNLFNPVGVLRKTMNRYKAIYDSRETFLSVGGSSACIIAAIMTLVRRGGKILIGADAHKAAWNALSLIQAEPICLIPEIVEESFIIGDIKPSTVERELQKNPDVEAVFLTSPNYYGICADIDKISEIAHKYGKMLIVDQAHGAHLKLMEEYGFSSLGAESKGADIVIESIHKTMASFTQTAVLNVYSDEIDLTALSRNLEIIQSSSPSYILMNSLDINAEIVELYAKELITRWVDNIDRFYKEASTINGIKLITGKNHDRSKINIDFQGLGISGTEAMSLFERQGIHLELSSGDMVMALTGIGNVKEDYDALIKALLNVVRNTVKKHRMVNAKNAVEEFEDITLDEIITSNRVIKKLPICVEFVNINYGVGRICAKPIVEYPPGIPIAVPGEELSDKVIKYIIKAINNGKNIMGINKEGMCLVGY